MNRSHAYHQYRGTQVQTSGTKNLMRMLHRGAVKFMNLAEKCIEEGEFAGANEHLIRSQDIVNEIRFSFPEGEDELSQNVRGLYAFMYRRLVQANVDKDAGMISEVRELIIEMGEAWDGAARAAEDGDGSIDVTG